MNETEPLHWANRFRKADKYLAGIEIAMELLLIIGVIVGGCYTGYKIYRQVDYPHLTRKKKLKDDRIILEDRFDDLEESEKNGPEDMWD